MIINQISNMKITITIIMFNTIIIIIIIFLLKKVYPVIPPSQGLNQRQMNRVGFTIINITVIECHQRIHLNI